jgi:L-2,4-diaminobutyrate decarboxylase
VPESNILCFRVEGHDQLDLRERILAGGQFHISSTTIAGERYLRVVVTTPDTTEATIEQLLDALRLAQHETAHA